jgi:hypothetical protein
MEKSQQIEFIREALSSLFHHTPVQFLKFLTRDGNVFLRFYWDQVAKNLKQTTNVPPYGLNYEIRNPFRDNEVVLIILPKPQVEGEAYFAALIFRPERVTPFLGISDITKVLTLELKSGEDGYSTTELVEYSRKGFRDVIREGNEPELESFYQIVLDEIR